MSQSQQSSDSNSRADIMQLLAMLADRKDELGSLLTLCDSASRRDVGESGSGGLAGVGLGSPPGGGGGVQHGRVEVDRGEVACATVGAVDAGSVSSGGTSWSDAVEVESEAGASGDGSVVGVPSATQRVRESVVFGGFGVAGEPAPVAEETRGLMSSHVRTPNARGIRGVFAALGISLPKQSAYDLALVTHTSATMPTFFKMGKQRLRAFAVLGDAALVAVLSARALERGDAVESLQSLRATALTDGNMARQFSVSTCAAFVTVGAGVSLAHTKTGATALEALAGLVAFYKTPRDVRALAVYFGLL